MAFLGERDKNGDEKEVSPSGSEGGLKTGSNDLSECQTGVQNH